MIDRVELVQRIEHRAAIGGIDAGRILHIQNGVALTAQGHAGVFRGQIAATPHAREERLRLTGGGESRREDDEGRQVIAFAAEAVGEPRADARLARHLAAGHDKGARGVVIDGAGVHAFDHRDVIDDFGRVRQQFADKTPALAVLRELKHARRHREACLATRHRRDALTVADALGQIFVVVLLELRFVVPQVELRRRAVHVQVNQPFRLRRKVWQPRQRCMHLRRGCALRELGAQHARESDIARAEAHLAKKLPARLLLMKFEKGVHGLKRTFGLLPALRRGLWPDFPQ